MSLLELNSSVQLCSVTSVQLLSVSDVSVAEMEACWVPALVKLCKISQFLINLFIYIFVSKIFLFYFIPLLTWQLINIYVVREPLISQPLKTTNKLCLFLIWWFFRNYMKGWTLPSFTIHFIPLVQPVNCISFMSAHTNKFLKYLDYATGALISISLLYFCSFFNDIWCVMIILII